MLAQNKLTSTSSPQEIRSALGKKVAQLEKKHGTKNWYNFYPSFNNNNQIGNSSIAGKSINNYSISLFRSSPVLMQDANRPLQNGYIAGSSTTVPLNFSNQIAQQTAQFNFTFDPVLNPDTISIRGANGSNLYNNIATSTPINGSISLNGVGNSITIDIGQNTSSASWSYFNLSGTINYFDVHPAGYTGSGPNFK